MGLGMPRGTPFLRSRPFFQPRSPEEYNLAIPNSPRSLNSEQTCYDFLLKNYTKLETISLQRVSALRVFGDLEKTVLHETRVSGTVLWSPTKANSPTYTYISQKTC